MAKGDFSFRGKSLEELEKMGVEEFAKLCSSRARRSLKRHVDKKFLEHVKKFKEVMKTGKFPKPVKTHYRDHVVLPEMVGATVAVYNGNSWLNVQVAPKMLGHFLGEFALTRKRLTHGKAGIGATRSSTAITARG